MATMRHRTVSTEVGKLSLTEHGEGPPVARTLPHAGHLGHSRACLPRSGPVADGGVGYGYRLAGPLPALRRAVVGALLSPPTRRHDTDAVTLVDECVATADQRQLHTTMGSVMFGRPDLSDRLPAFTAPTLFAISRDHPQCTPQQTELSASCCHTAMRR